MLVLTREIGETFSIGDDITVQILGINGNQVRLGINAPKDIKPRSTSASPTNFRNKRQRRFNRRRCSPH
ncbi:MULTISPECIES: carbon storage regulator [Pseudomonas syringae group]|nr:MULTISPECIES: carbon storage regulator [Pseudomonas syringae group]SOS19097.1 hypothetical protein CFBP6109_03501 [Pseudomonas syringae pv. cerasicola]SPF14336.1 hypothetical protein PSCFBP6110_01832 [Pseudomonas syringae pv. cerasicola]